MKSMFRNFGLGFLFALTAGHAAAQSDSTAASQAYPNRAVRIVVPFPAGGTTDILARAVGQKLNEAWGQSVVVENRAGGNTVIGAQLVAHAAPDGHTLLMAIDSTLVMNPFLYKKLPYDPFKDFTPVTLMTQNTSLLMVNAATGPKTVKELIAKAKANPGKLNYGSGTITTRLAGYLFNKAAGLDIVFIPYRGGSEVMQGLLAGSVDMIIDGAVSSLSLVQGGKVRALAKLNSRPFPEMPDLQPLAIAAELPGFEDLSTWIGIVAPSGTPSPIVEKIQREVARALADAALKEKLAKAGINVVGSTPAEFDAFIRKEADRWSSVLKETGISFD